MTQVFDGHVSIALAETVDGVRIQVADSVAFGSRENAGDIVVCGSHGGRSAGEYAAQFTYGGLITSDAGGGLNNAGTAGLRALDDVNVPAAGVAHTSARIGDGRDIWESGIVSFANETARALGVRVGQTTQIAARVMARGIASGTEREER